MRDQHSPQQSGRFSMGGLDIPLPTWAVYSLALLVVVCAASQLAVKFVFPVLGYEPIDKEERLRLEEANAHYLEVPESEEIVVENNAEVVTVGFLASDKCLQIVRKPTNGKPQVQFIPDPARIAAPPQETAAFHADDVHLASVVPIPTRSCGGRCLNPHPGYFEWWYGARSGCWVQVWRSWPDGCRHWQAYNSCYNTWDPKINWVCCVH